LQNTDNGRCRPATVLFICISSLCMGHPLAPFICQRGENTQPVQLICNMCRTEPLQAFPENVLYHIGGILVNLQALVLVTGLDVAIDSESPDKIAAAPLHIQGAPGLNGNI